MDSSLLPAATMIRKRLLNPLCVERRWRPRLHALAQRIPSCGVVINLLRLHGMKVIGHISFLFIIVLLCAFFFRCLLDAADEFYLRFAGRLLTG